jgi:nucleoside-diphosphate-sugar epimerase
MSDKTFLVTGALGCLGAWSLHHLAKDGQRAVSFDLHTGGHRLNLLLTEEEKKAITFVMGDLSDPEQVMNVFRDHNITHVIHLAALQVPFCRADPVRGAQVNVTGTVNVFEAARQHDVKHIAYASSIAVYGPPSDYPPGLVAHDAPFAPRTLYGVYKSANEGTAKIYWQDHQISSVSLRPYTVYGVARDQGVTSDPTKAMFAVAAAQDFHINFSGKMQFQFASDVARQFIDAAITAGQGAFAFNMGTEPMTVRDVAAMINAHNPDVSITVEETILPFPEGFDDSAMKDYFDTVYQTPLDEGIAQTVEFFRMALAEGRMSYAT